MEKSWSDIKVTLVNCNSVFTNRGALNAARIKPQQRRILWNFLLKGRLVRLKPCINSYTVYRILCALFRTQTQSCHRLFVCSPTVSRQRSETLTRPSHKLEVSPRHTSQHKQFGTCNVMSIPPYTRQMLLLFCHFNTSHQLENLRDPVCPAPECQLMTGQLEKSSRFVTADRQRWWIEELANSHGTSADCL